MNQPNHQDDENSELARVLQRFEKTAQERLVRDAAEGRIEPPPSSSAKIIQLPLWPEPVRGAPNSFLRSALFAAIQGKGRKQMKRQLLATMQGVTVRFTGQQLDQSDLDVWEQSVHLVRFNPVGNVCCFTGYAFLKALGRNTGNAEYQWLDDAIERLIACAVIIQTREKEYVGNLIGSCLRDKETRRYKLALNPDTVKLYGWNDWTAIDWEQRQALRGKPLALWLHGFYCTHAKPHPIKIQTLRDLSGSATKELRKFKQNLTTAFEHLEAATGITGTIDADRVTVERIPSRCQQRHLTRRAKQHAAIHKPRHKPQNCPARLGDF